MDRRRLISARRFLLNVAEYERILEEESLIAAEIKEAEAMLAKSMAEAEAAERELRMLEEEKKKCLERQESYEEELAELSEKIADAGSVLVHDAALIDGVESLIKDRKIVCDFYASDPEIMKEMKRRGLPCLPWPY